MAYVIFSGTTSNGIVLELDIFQAPLGGNSCGLGPLKKYITRGNRNSTFKLDCTITRKYGLNADSP